MFSKQEFKRFIEGDSHDAHRFLGAHFMNDGDMVKQSFCVYAPNAKAVYLIASFNHYQGDNYQLKRINESGFFVIILDGSFEYETYKYEIHTMQGDILYKADPFAFFGELRPHNASKIYDINGYTWHDDKWLYEKKKPYQEPLLIYEVHLGSWQRHFGLFKTYRELAKPLADYVLNQGFTHIELLPIYEHPLDDSWGYQGTGYFAATARFGEPKDFMYFIDYMHQRGIGVILDWVLGHICKDAFGLSFFDGTPLYEFEDELKRENVEWGTSNLDFSKGITRSFMQSALTFWMDNFHVDGFRIDAVSRLIYHLGDPSIGVNQDAIKFIQDVSQYIFDKDERFLFIAEDSTTYPHVTLPADQGGVGFNYKWNMGFMNDVLHYFKEDPIFRKYHHNNITFGLVYAFKEQFILPFSHDEVVHMKGSLVNKMPGDFLSQLANWKLLMTLWMTHPGKKLLFMGQEFAQRSEWTFQHELDWDLLNNCHHQRANMFFKDLAMLYKNHDALYAKDHDPTGFQWLVLDDADQSVFAYARFGLNETIIVILNMTPNIHQTYDIPVPCKGKYELLINSNDIKYDGHDHQKVIIFHAKKGNHGPFDYYIQPKLTSFASMIFILKK